MNTNKIAQIFVIGTALDSLKSEKQRLYETYVLDEKGQIKLYAPVVQKVLLALLEEGKLEEEVKALDAELNKEE